MNLEPLFPDIRFLLAVDPGKRYAGCALFEDGRLVDAARPAPGVGKSWRDVEHIAAVGRALDEWAGMRTQGGCVCVAEMMEPRARNPNMLASILPLCALSGWIVGAASDGRLVPVLEWKSTYSKQQIHGWVRLELDDGELDVLERCCADLTAADALDVWDAVGIGLWALGRDVRRHKGA